ncbi:DNA cytosine methyltransferase [Phocaeicola coprocola]|uniref:DNA cytosine methyltransferase n=1 Tax=Phocaeicola coprocola TaxID=310298 RepID=UPI003A8E1DB7
MTHASIFSGIGGAELAAAWMGWTNLFHCEIQDFPRQVLDYWFPDSISYGDITRTNFEQWNGKVDVLTGGFPCQPFSLAGQRRGADDNRYLWPEMLRAIREINPTWVVGENVTGIKTMVESCEEIKVGRTDDLFEENYIYREESWFTLEKICEELNAAGYSVQPFVIPACAVGAPHRRDRIWIVAHRTDSGIETMQQKRKDGVSSSGTSSYTDGFRQGNRQKQHRVYHRMPQRDRPWHLLQNRDFFQRGNSWENFPTQSPICRGNDGIPFDVDSLTISFARWRKESIKAYGNAWVPQVAFEIFKAIEKVHLN